MTETKTKEATNNNKGRKYEQQQRKEIQATGTTTQLCKYLSFSGIRRNYIEQNPENMEGVAKVLSQDVWQFPLSAMLYIICDGALSLWRMM